jgi:type IV secretory pathway VirJ component
MMRILGFACLLFVALGAPRPAGAAEITAHGHFAQVHLYRPAGPPRQFVLFLSGDEGWTAPEARQAALLARRGALVAGVDLTRLEGTMKPKDILFGDLENLSHYLQGYARLETYRTPLLAAAPSTAPLARSLTAKASADIFAGVLEADAQLLPAYDRLAAAIPALPPPPASLAGLPVIEAPATGPATTAAARETVAFFLSGDGGWAGLDKQVAAALQARGIPVVGLDSLRYFWSARTPDGLARDLDRMARYYTARWQKRRVLIIGYSQGANVLPAAYNRLPDATRQRVTQMVLIGLEARAAWQFHLANWIGRPADAQPIQPEAVRLNAATVLCLYGEGDGGALCPQLPPASVTAEVLPGGHHFNGAYGDLAARILARLE